MRRSQRRRDARGAVAILVALVMCFVLLPITALVVDIGMQRVARRDVQAIADVAALDAGRALAASKATAAGVATANELRNVALAAMRRGSSGVGANEPTIEVTLGTVVPAGYLSDQALGCAGSPYNSYFRQAPSGAMPDAVLVTVRSSVDFIFKRGSGEVCRSAVGLAQRIACFSVDSYAARLKAEGSTVLGPITALLGTSLDLALLSSSGLLDAEIDILAFLNLLKADLNLATLDQVLTAEITLAQLIGAQVEALTSSGGTAVLAADALSTHFLANVGDIADRVRVGELLQLSQGAGAALGAAVNAFDLAVAGLAAATKNRGIELNVGALPGVADLVAKAYVIQGPANACGAEGAAVSNKPTASTAQTRVEVSGSLAAANRVTKLLNALTGLLGLLTGHTLSVNVDPFLVDVKLAEASGTLKSINCTDGEVDSLTIAARSALMPATIRIPVTITDTRARLIGPPEVKTTTITVVVSTITSTVPTTEDVTLLVPEHFGEPVDGPSGDLSIDKLSITADVSSDPDNVLGTVLGGVSDVIELIDTELVRPLMGDVLRPLLGMGVGVLENALGLTIAGSQFTPTQTLVPSCGSPALAN
ncbi:hypothetical protein GGQ22_10090 [Nocardioides sp. zg-579]|uniref:Putative Flp pilus-assembly TadG-like N-terminal domain-containing protein n=1 Tax=Nocardioides marmotae TaxID=2663857 RepID=A0A6I3JBC6_9ACTN|nr:pilus assembly protein TadG-related protein [Nocardioides marmotae]MCR6031794.1 hypothetical protein [Gordonia jinghuaiqii]MTB95434.1 hypothetical protein [Nocardioides marmotae]QKE00874.1 hypothetical protein HPC71_07150 [Nocardioides marmotae]